MNYAIYQRLGLGTPTPTMMWLLIEDRSIKRPVASLFDVLAKIDRFILPVYFFVPDCQIYQEVPIILSLPFYAIRRAFVNL